MFYWNPFWFKDCPVVTCACSVERVSPVSACSYLEQSDQDIEIKVCNTNIRVASFSYCLWSHLIFVSVICKGDHYPGAAFCLTY